MLDRQTVSHYRILRTLELGGNTEVYEAEDTVLGRRVVLRVLAEHLRGDAPSVNAFLEDARAASKLDHPHICSIFAVDQEDGVPFMAVEFLSGKPLSEALRETRWPLERTVEMAIELCEGLDAAHAQGIVHGDICPANLFLTRDGQLKILGFQSGPKVAAIQESVTRPVSDERRVYLAPERVAGHPAEAHGDLFSAGAVLYEAVTGLAPFRGARLENALHEVTQNDPEAASRLNPEVWPALETVITRALEKDPELRYQSARDLRNDLRMAQREMESGAIASVVAAAEPPTLASRRNWLVAAAALPVLALVAYFGFDRLWPAPDTPAAASKAYLWLQAQQTPAGWVASYEGDDEYCYTYDQALASIAFLSRGDNDAATRALESLKRVQNASGSWYAAYSCKLGTPRRGEQYVGVTAWVVLATAQYRRATGRTDFDEMAHRALRFCLGFQQADGGVNGGLDKTGTRYPWASTEHNLDLLNALRYYGYRTAAAGVAAFLDQSFDSEQGRFHRGRNDSTDALDVVSLAIAALGPGDDGRYLRSLDFAERTHRTRQPLTPSWFSRRVDGFHVDAAKNDIWSEGTAQMAIAFRLAGRNKDADYFTRELVKMQAPSGGLRYSIHGAEHEGSALPTAASVASTSWFILAIDQRNPMQP